MRFAFKTAPQNTTWRDMLAVGIGAGWNEEESGAYGIELGGRLSAATGSRKHARSSSAC